jgi:hypothetical protein
MIIALFGLVCFVIGLLSLFSERFNKSMDKVRARNETQFDRDLLSKKNRYFVSRYLAGFSFVCIGIGLIILYWLDFRV